MLEWARGAKSLNGELARKAKNAFGLPNRFAQPICPATLLLGRLTRAWSSFDTQTLSAFLVLAAVIIAMPDDRFNRKLYPFNANCGF